VAFSISPALKDAGCLATASISLDFSQTCLSQPVTNDGEPIIRYQQRSHHWQPSVSWRSVRNSG
jgi:hypothetical protein